MSIRRQLAVSSPVTLGAVGRGLLRAASRTRVHREALRGILASHFGSRTVLLTDSGTHALTLALQAVALEAPNLPVAIPAYCCYDVATAVVGAGLRAILYDIDPATLGPDLGSLERVLRRGGGVSGIVVAHLFGMPIDLPAIMRLAHDAGVDVIEDACQGAGAALRGRPLGSHASLGVLSFGRGKGVTSGRGGALLVNDQRGADLLARCRFDDLPLSSGIRELPALIAQWALGRPALYGLPASIPWLRLGETVYRDPTPIVGMSDFAVGVLSHTWVLGAAEAERRRRNAEAFAVALGPKSRLLVATGATPGFLRFPILTASRASGLARAGERLGVVRGYPTTLAQLPQLVQQADGSSETYPGARELSRDLVLLPTHGLLTTDERSRIISLVRASMPVP